MPTINSNSYEEEETEREECYCVCMCAGDLKHVHKKSIKKLFHKNVYLYLSLYCVTSCRFSCWYEHTLNG